jgi:hypothetical protein
VIRDILETAGKGFFRIMPKSRGRKRKPRGAQSQTPKPTTPAKELRSRPLGRLIAIILGLATLVGVPAAVIAFWPRMTVTASGLYDDSNAYSETFSVANTGFLPLEDVQVGIGICSIETEKLDFNVSKDNCFGEGAHIVIAGPPWWTPELRRDEPFSIVLSDGMNVATEKYREAHPKIVGGIQMLSELKSANVIVTITSKPWPLWWTIRRGFRFVAEEQPNGKIMWRAVPLSWTNIQLPDPY